MYQMYIGRRVCLRLLLDTFHIVYYETHATHCQIHETGCVTRR